MLLEPAREQRQSRNKIKSTFRRTFQSLSSTPCTATQIASIYVLCGLSGLLGFAPSVDEPISGVFGAVLLFTLVTSIGTKDFTIRFDVIGLSIFAFLYLCLFSATGAIVNGTPISIWARGLVPFLVLAVYWVIPSRPLAGDLQHCVNAIQIGCLIWAVKVAILGWSFLPGVLHGSVGRLTYVVSSTLVPYGLIGLSLVLFNPDLRSKRTMPIQVLIFLFMIVACGYRSQIVIAAALLIMRTLRRNAILGMIAFGTVAILVSSSIALMRDTEFFSTKLERFEDGFENGFEGRRQLETEFAIDAFLESYMFGKGLGYQIPIWAIEDHGNLKHIDQATIGYLHNVWLYLLMDLGLAGAVAYCGFTVVPIWRGFVARHNHSQLGNLEVCIAVTLVSILMYSSVQACFRSIQVNLVIAFLAAISCSANSMRSRHRAQC